MRKIMRAHNHIIQRSLVYGAPYWETKDTSQKNHQSVILSFVFIRYRDSEDNTVGKNYSVFSLIRQQGHAGSKTLHRQNAPVLNWRCRLTQVDMAIKRGWLLLSICYCVIGHVVTLTYFAQMRSMTEWTWSSITSDRVMDWLTRDWTKERLWCCVLPVTEKWHVSACCSEGPP